MLEEKNSIQSIEVKLPSAQEMVEAGVHFGHKTSRWHPKMEQYIFGSRNGIHIFDIDKTLKKMEEAILFMGRVLANGGAILFVGTGARDKPSADVLAALASATILRTDERGSIEMIVDGQTLAVRTKK